MPAVNEIEGRPSAGVPRCSTTAITNTSSSRWATALANARGNRLNDDRLEYIASAYDKTSAQILLRWSFNTAPCRSRRPTSPSTASRIWTSSISRSATSIWPSWTTSTCSPRLSATESRDGVVEKQPDAGTADRAFLRRDDLRQRSGETGSGTSTFLGCQSSTTARRTARSFPDDVYINLNTLASAAEHRA